MTLSSTIMEVVKEVMWLKEVTWLKGLANELDFEQMRVIVHCDNQNTICLTKNP